MGALRVSAEYIIMGQILYAFSGKFEGGSRWRLFQEARTLDTNCKKKKKKKKKERKK